LSGVAPFFNIGVVEGQLQPALQGENLSKDNAPVTVMARIGTPSSILIRSDISELTCKSDDRRVMMFRERMVDT